MSGDLQKCPLCGGEHVFIRDYLDDGAKHHGYCHDCGGGSGAYPSREEARIAWNCRASGWIPVKDEEPVDGFTVLAFIKNGEMAVVEAGSLFWDEYEVTHWMPLPDEPEAG